MFCFINNLRSRWRGRIATSRSGQVAVIMIVIIAIGLILFAASINLTMMSQTKTLTMKAANAAASSMASYIASSGQKEYIETMGWRVHYCKSSGFGFLTLLAMIVLAVVTWGSSTYATIAYAAAVGAVMEAASLIIAASIDPGISDMWNQMQSANLSPTGQAVERGIQTALQAVQTDTGKVPDIYDMDQDGLFGFVHNDETQEPKDTIARFALYNTRRMAALQGPDVTEVRNFENAFHELVVQGTDGWGLWDPVYYPDEKTKAIPSMGINPNPNHACFLPADDPANDPLHATYNARRPAECDFCCSNFDGAIPKECDTASGQEQIGIRSTCAGRSPYQSLGNEYPFVYDFSYEDSTNGFMSFREALGRDDEHHLYHVKQANSNWHSDPGNGRENYSPVDAGFHLKDTVGFYTSPNFSLANPDIWMSPSPPRRPTLFSFLYKMRYAGSGLGTLDFAANPYECHWCDAHKPTDPGLTCPADIWEYPDISGTNRLTLPAGGPGSAPYNSSQSWCLDTANSGRPNDPPLLVDPIPGLPKLFVNDNDCAINYAAQGSPDLSQYVGKANGTSFYGGWKKGSDRYCSHTAGVNYAWDCPKSIGGAIPPTTTANPQCGQPGAAPASQWPDDMIDQIVYGLPALYQFEETLWKAQDHGGMKVLAEKFVDWYGSVTQGQLFANGIADWIEPPCLDVNNCPGSFTKLARPGKLYIWREELQWINKQIQEWLVPAAGDPEYVGTTAFGPGATWCLPPNIVFPGISPDANQNIPLDEQATYDVNGNGVRGDVADVIACLKWNAENVHAYPAALGLQPAKGNAEKFQTCHDHCGAATCTNVLPRSLVPDFYDPVKMPVFTSYPADEAKFNACLGAQTIQQCSDNCKNGVIPSGNPYAALPVFQDPILQNIARIDSWCLSNPDQIAQGYCNGNNMVGHQADLYCQAINGQPQNDQACRCSWANDCAGIASQCAPYCTASGLCGMNYRNKVNDQLLLSKGPCLDPNSQFLDIIQQSADEARIQVAKLKHRADYLQARYDEAMALSNDTANPRMDPTKPDGILTVAIKNITAFLDNGTPLDYTDSPAERIIQARINHMQEISGDLPSFAIYVWQDKDADSLNRAGNPRWGTGEGYWHAVKVQVSMPKRCGGNCLAIGWPKVHSTESGGGFLEGTKICYDLINLDGITKARVIRYDQDKDLTGLLFPGGQRIWESRFSHPQSGAPDPTGIRGTCSGMFDPDLARWLNTPGNPRSTIGAAFMLDRVPGDLTDGSNYSNCWLKVHRDLLAHGIQSESCARYYMVDDGHTGFRVKFVPCDNW